MMLMMSNLISLMTMIMKMKNWLKWKWSTWWWFETGDLSTIITVMKILIGNWFSFRFCFLLFFLGQRIVVFEIRIKMMRMTMISWQENSEYSLFLFTNSGIFHNNNNNNNRFSIFFCCSNNRKSMFNKRVKSFFLSYIHHHPGNNKMR